MSSAINLGMTTNYGDIYYTTDGSDPRESITSNVSSAAQLFVNKLPLSTDVTIKARAKSGNEWSPITTGKFTFNEVTASKEVDETDFSHGNYPNPFHESTQIHYTLPFDGDVDVDIVSIDGRLLKKLFSGY